MEGEVQTKGQQHNLGPTKRKVGNVNLIISVMEVSGLGMQSTHTPIYTHIHTYVNADETMCERKMKNSEGHQISDKQIRGDCHTR